jgi:hypothetical protein
MIGIFSQNPTPQLLGFMRMNWNNQKSVWLEGGRIRATHQKTGLGKILLEYVLKKSKQEGAEIAQYDTSSRNFGSIALARKYGFEEKTRMRALYIAKPNLERLTSSDPTEPLQYISAQNSYEILKRIKNGPSTELNLGWAYIPFNKENIISHTSRWIRNDNAIALVYTNNDRILNREFPDPESIWFITYGDELAIQKLVIQAILNLKNEVITQFSVFCPESAADLLESRGFGYYEKEITSVVLFEKKFTN